MSTSNNNIQMNQNESNLSQTCLITEVIELQDDYGKKHKVLVLYDWGSTNTSISNEKAVEIYGNKPLDLTFIVDNMSSGQVSLNV